jgi:hypothetical protein
MRTLLVLLLLSTELGGVFGPATADAVAVSSGEIEVTITVTVATGPVGVVAHLVDPGDDQQTVTLGHQGDGEYAGAAVTERADLVVVFEAIGADGSSELSRPVTLIELGVDPTIMLDDTSVIGGGDDGLTLDAATERWGWAAVALGAAALSLVAWWALADYPKRRREEKAGPHE